MIAGGHQACLTRKRRAGTTARLMGTMREALPSHEEAVEKFETLSMEGGDVRPAGPATPRFVAGDLAHIRSGILRHALSAPAADQVPRGSYARTAFSALAMQKARPLLRSCPRQFWCAHEAWAPGPRTQPESPRRPVLGTCRDLWGWIFSTTSVTLGLYHNFHFSFPVWSADPGPGTLPGSVSRCGRKRAEATVTRRSPGPRFSMCHGQALQFTSSPLARTAPSRRGTRGRLSSRRLARAPKEPPVLLVVRGCEKVSAFAWWRSLHRTWAGRRALDARWPRARSAIGNKPHPFLNMVDAAQVCSA